MCQHNYFQEKSNKNSARGKKKLKHSKKEKSEL